MFAIENHQKHPYITEELQPGHHLAFQTKAPPKFSLPWCLHWLKCGITLNDYWMVIQGASP